MKLHISNKEYRSLDAVSRSDLMELRKSPKHFRFKSDSNIADDSKALIFGSLVHKLVLEPDTFDDEFASKLDAFYQKHDKLNVLSINFDV